MHGCIRREGDVITSYSIHYTKLYDPKRKTIGLRIPEHPVVAGLLAELGEPILTSTLILPDEEAPMRNNFV